MSRLYHQLTELFLVNHAGIDFVTLCCSVPVLGSIPLQAGGKRHGLRDTTKLLSLDRGGEKLPTHGHPIQGE